MKTIFKLMCVTLALLVSFSVSAQKKEKPFKGIIRYSVNMEGDFDAQTKAQLPTEAVVYVLGEKLRTDQVSPVVTFGQVVLEDGSAIILVEAMGQKIASKQSKADLDKAKEEAKESGVLSDKEPTVKITDETKMIAGYKCKKAEVTDENGETMEVFFTDEIVMPANYTENSPIKGINGMLMEYTTTNNGMTSTMTAKEVKKGGVNNSMFMVTDDYQEVPWEQFIQMLGGGM